MSARRLAATPMAATVAAGLGWGAYLSVIGLAADRSLRAERLGSTATDARLRFRILVPAHDEETIIAGTLDALLGIDYPADKFEIHVVADNCQDRTASIVRARGVDAHERTDAIRQGKGPALAWMIDRLPVGAPTDVIVVIDADTTVSPGLLRAFERQFAQGEEVVQGHYMVKDAATGGEIGFRAAALAVRHLVRPAGRTALGGSSSLYGNGMAFRESIARQYRWSDALTEDLEMGLRLLLDGHPVGFAPDAELAAEMPASRVDARSQNERWESGRSGVAVTFVPQLLRAARDRAHGRRWRYVDAAIDISMPPLTMVLASTMVGGAGVLAFGRGRFRRIGVASAVGAVTLQMTHVVHALAMAKAPPAVWRSLLKTPSHALWKAQVVTGVLRGQPRSWVRTERNAMSAVA